MGSGLPRSLSSQRGQRSWYEHACEYVDHKWPHISARHRKGIAEGLTVVTTALLADLENAPPSRDIRRALYRWSFNTVARSGPPADDDLAVLSWIERESPTLRDLQDAVVLRKALHGLSVTLQGRPAAASTVRRKRSALYGALQYAVELEIFDANPLDRLSWKPTPSSDIVDRRVVVNPEQARALLAAVREISPATEGFFACLYYAGLRPAEAANLRLIDLTLPPEGWGELLLASSHQRAGRAWTDSGEAGEERSLKHRAARDIRRVPAHPELVATLQRHIDTFRLGVDGRLFVTRTGRAGVPLPPPYSNPLSLGTAYRVWHKARGAVLPPEQLNTPLARRPYDLRHACLSTWLNAGVPPTQVAEWAGHSVNVLLRVYAKCLDGQDEAAKKRIEAALDQ